MDHDIGDARLEILKYIIAHARDDQHAIRRRDGARWGYIKRAGAISDDALIAHLNGGPHLGAYLMGAGEDTTKLAAFDIDNHDRALPWPRVQSKAREIIVAARAGGLCPWPVRSGGGAGIHIFFFWDQPQPAGAVREAMAALLRAAGLREGAGGLPAAQVEIFPKQDQLARSGDGSVGSLIGLPFARASAPLGDDLEPCNEPSLIVTSGPVGSAPGHAATRRAPPKLFDMPAIAEAIAHLSPDEYDDWLAVGMALKLEAGEPGFATWRAWSAKSSKFRGDADLRAKWKSFRRDGTGGTVLGLDAIFSRARDAGWAGRVDPAPLFSDEWLALEFAESHAESLRFTNAWNQWNEWDGCRWRSDDTLAALDLAREHCRAVAARANKKRAQIASAHTSHATIMLARADRRLAMRAEQWDAHPWLLATPDGTVDLRTGDLRPARPDDHITRATAVAPGGECPLWKETLTQIFEGDAHRIRFLQVFLGYCLTGSIGEEKYLFLHGAGGNGKGTITETVCHVLGDYATAVPESLLIQTRDKGHPTEIAKLRGARLAVAAEVPPGARWDTGRLKALTGGGAVSARRMREDFSDFVPQFKLLICGNNYPALGHVDEALRRRTLLMELRATFKTDPARKPALLREAGGILAWLIEGAAMYKREGLRIPAGVLEETADYLREMDDFVRWFDECCVAEPDPSGRKATTRELFGSFQDWTKKNGGDNLTAEAFVARLRAVGLRVDTKRGHGLRRVSGVRLISPIEILERDESEYREDDTPNF